MNVLDVEVCEEVGGGLTPLQMLSVWGWGYGVARGLVTFTVGLGEGLRNVYGEDTALEAFRGGNLGA